MNTPNYFFTQITWFPIIIFWLAYVMAALFYFTRIKPKFFNFKILIIFIIICRFIYAAILSILQYYVWSTSELTKLLISSPLSSEVPLSDALRGILGPVLDSKLGYFLFYSWGHFWISALITIGIAFAFYAFLKALKKYNGRFFEEGETELGLLLALIVGWPNFVLFIPITFASVVVVSVFRLLYKKELYTTLGAPMFLAALVTLIYGGNLIKILGLTVLKI